MIRFSVEQKVYNIGGIEIGGQPGERPTVLVGSIFFAGHRIVHDPVKGLFDRDKAKTLLQQEAEVSAFTGNPRFLDVVGDTAEALINYIEFVAVHSEAPILVDSPLQRVRIEVISHFAGSEIMPRLIYNSIAEDHTEEELACLKDCGVKSAVLLAFGTKAIKPEARVELLKDDLLPAAESAAIENIIIDTGVLDVSSVSWASLAIREVKEKLGFPAGCAPANAMYAWEKMKARGAPAFQTAASATLALAKSQGADFLFYGSLQNAPWVYSAVATMDALIAYGGRFSGLRVATQEHPLYRVL